jgi:antitoxin ParD1/3/4
MSIRVDIGDDLEKQVSGLVTRGRYQSEADLVRSAVQLLVEKEARLASLERDIHAGLEDIEAGRTVSSEQVFASLRAKYGALRGD